MPTRLAAGNPAIAKLVEKQLRNWELARDQRPSGAREQESESREPEVEEFICVSRMVGTDGWAVAERLGESLGWPVFDRELLEAMSGDDEIRRQIYASMDERDLSWWEETLRSVMQGEFVKNDYFHRLCETLLSLARQGKSVFLGRGADLVLPAGYGFRVRLVAPVEARRRRFAADNHLTAVEAAREIDRLERVRFEFFRHHFRRDPNDPSRSDMVVNMESFTAGQAADLILRARELHSAG